MTDQFFDAGSPLCGRCGLRLRKTHDLVRVRGRKQVTPRSVSEWEAGVWHRRCLDLATGEHREEAALLALSMTMTGVVSG